MTLGDRFPHVQSKVLVRMRIFWVVCLVMAGLTVGEALVGTITWPMAGAGLIGGFVLGLVASRINVIRWDADAAKAVSAMDWVGGVILIAYIVLAVLRGRILGHWAQGPALFALTLAVLAGVFFGRVVGTARGLRIALAAVGINVRGRP